MGHASFCILDHITLEVSRDMLLSPNNTNTSLQGNLFPQTFRFLYYDH